MGDFEEHLRSTGSDEFELVGDATGFMGGMLSDARTVVSDTRINGQTIWTDGRIWISVTANHLDVDVTDPWLRALLPEALAALNALDPLADAQPIEA